MLMCDHPFRVLSDPASASLAVFTVVSGVAIIVLIRWYRNKTRRHDMELPLEQQSVEAEGTDGARRNKLSSEIIARQYPDVTTVYESFLRGVKLSGDGPCLGTRDPISKKYTWLTYNQVHERATFVGAGLVALGCEPSQQTYIGIYGPNRVEWALTDLGCQMFSMISVPVYDTHGAEECIYIINHDVLTVCYTSGTTGPPKGAILTHANLVADISAYRWMMLQSGFELTTEDVQLSFLPLAHMYERINHLNLFVSGGRIGYYSGDVKQLLEDCKELK
ncbi:long-chain-fatty-acid--CoA ligase 5-like [Stylophora pistillata]|uniref:long-chain-fatty-acid--CoA ligase 5-like n=1 Tax=Stylophora pistillata TaxID=50429 RepID=UPI000C04BB4C|nr:long-chain-fatty-acid--CoA ligase 5-like [Stylophora pistillata]